jgi:hypothetical protein
MRAGIVAGSSNIIIKKNFGRSEFNVKINTTCPTATEKKYFKRFLRFHKKAGIKLKKRILRINLKNK